MERSDNTPTGPVERPAPGEKRPKRDKPVKDDGARGYYSGVRLPDEPTDT